MVSLGKGVGRTVLGSRRLFDEVFGVGRSAGAVDGESETEPQKTVLDPF